MFDLHPGFARALLEALPGGVAFIDRQDRVQWVNAEFAALLGSDPTRLVGRPAESLPFPHGSASGAGERCVLAGDLVVIERALTCEPLVGRVLQILPRQPLQAALPPLRALPPELPVGQGILPRDTGLQRLAIEISRSRRYENPLSCLVARLEGADAGCTVEAMRDLTMLLKEQLRWVDVLVQWTPEALLVLLPETGAEAAFRLLRKLARLIDLGRSATPVEARIHWGSATWRRGDDAARMVRRAEAASHAEGSVPGATRFEP